MKTPQVFRLYLVAILSLLVAPSNVLAIAGGKKAVDQVTDDKTQVKDDDSAVVVGCGPMAGTVTGGYRAPSPRSGNGSYGRETTTPRWNSGGPSNGIIPRSVTTSSSFTAICSGFLACDNATVTAWHCVKGKYGQCTFRVSKDKGPAQIPGSGLNPNLSWTTIDVPRPITSSFEMMINGNRQSTTDGFAIFRNSSAVKATNKFSLASILSPIDDVNEYGNAEIWGYGMERYEPNNSGFSYSANKKSLAMNLTTAKPFELHFSSSEGAACGGDSGARVAGKGQSSEGANTKFLGTLLGSTCKSGKEGNHMAIAASPVRDQLLSELNYTCSASTYIRLELDESGTIPPSIELRAKVRRNNNKVIGKEPLKCAYPNPVRSHCEGTVPLNNNNGDWVDLEAVSSSSSVSGGTWSCKYDNWATDQSKDKQNSKYPPNGVIPITKGSKATVLVGPYGNQEQSKNRRGLVCRYKIPVTTTTLKLYAYPSDSTFATRENYQVELVAVPIKSNITTLNPIASMGRLDTCKFKESPLQDNRNIPTENVDICKKEFTLQTQNGETIGNWFRIAGRLMTVNVNGSKTDITGDIKKAYWLCSYEGTDSLYPPSGAAAEFALKAPKDDTVITTDSIWAGPHPTDAGIKSIGPKQLVSCGWYFTLKERDLVSIYSPSTQYTPEKTMIINGTNDEDKRVTVRIDLTSNKKDASPKVKLKFSGLTSEFEKINVAQKNSDEASDFAIDNDNGEVTFKFKPGQTRVSLELTPKTQFLQQGQNQILTIEITEVSDSFSISQFRKKNILTEATIILQGFPTPFRPYGR